MSETKHTPLPCGLCGSPARVSRRSGVTGTACKSRYYREAVVCTGCGVSTKEVKVPGVAVERWNARSASIAALSAENERLRKALEFYADPAIYKPHPHGPAFDRRDLSFHAISSLEATP